MTTSTPSFDASGEDIVIVDDTADSLNLLAEILTGAGYRVRAISYGAVALHSISKHSAKLVLLACRIPDMDGFELCSRLKASEQTADIPIIFLSSLGNMDERSHCFELGAVDYIVKPFLSQDVLLRVKTHANLASNYSQFKEQNSKLITLQQQLARELKIYKKFQTVFNETLDGIALLDIDSGIVVDCNPSFERQCGYSARQLKTMLIWELFPVVQTELREAFFRDVITGGSGRSDQLLIEQRDGTQISVELLAKMIELEKADYLHLIVRDISQRKPKIVTHIVNAFDENDDPQANNYRFRQLFEAMNEGCFLAELIIDPSDNKPIDWYFLESNATHAKTLNLTPAQVIGKTLREVLLTVDDKWFETAARTAMTGEPTTLEGFASVTGRHYEYHYYSPQQGQVACIFTDITRRKRALEKRDGAQRKFHKVLEDSIQALIIALEMRDPYTAGHQKRVAKLAVAIGREMGLADVKVQGLYFGALLHDIGKIAVPAELLNRPGRLNDVEYQLVKQHPQTGFNIVKDIAFPWPVAQIILQHHEYIDGSGYPQGLTGEAILLEAKILTVADTVEAMYSNRPHRPSLGIEKALAHLTERPNYYDADVVAATLKLFEEQGVGLLNEMVDYVSRISRWSTNNAAK